MSRLRPPLAPLRDVVRQFTCPTGGVTEVVTLTDRRWSTEHVAIKAFLAACPEHERENLMTERAR